jgi:hypothetical protein
VLIVTLVSVFIRLAVFCISSLSRPLVCLLEEARSIEAPAETFAFTTVKRSTPTSASACTLIFVDASLTTSEVSFVLALASAVVSNDVPSSVVRAIFLRLTTFTLIFCDSLSPSGMLFTSSPRA